MKDLSSMSKHSPSSPSHGIELSRYLAPLPRQLTTNIQEMLRRLRTTHSELNELRKNLQIALSRGDTACFQALLQKEWSYYETYQNYVHELQRLEHAELLTPFDMKTIGLIREELDFQMEQVTLDTKEGTGVCRASLILVRSPFPLVLSKGKNLEKLVRVRFVKGIQQELSCDMRFEGKTVVEQTSRVPVQDVVETVKTETKSDDEVDLRMKIVNGSRMLPVTMKIAVTVNHSAGPLVLETLSSRPFVVITNESQFEDGNLALLKYLAFGNGQTTEWPHFANVLQEHFMRVTKQADLITDDPRSAIATEHETPVRIMSKRELNYLHTRFFGNAPTVTLDQFNNFWPWFGKVIVRMRSAKHAVSMWRKGLLWPFCSRDEIDAALVPHPPGTFLTRFSESNPGFFAIAYRVATVEGSSDSPVHHYLVKADEISIQKSLPDLLAEISDLTIALMMFDNDFGDEPLRPLFTTMPKNAALRNYVSRRKPVVANGYEKHIGGVTHPSS